MVATPVPVQVPVTANGAAGNSVITHRHQRFGRFDTTRFLEVRLNPLKARKL